MRCGDTVAVSQVRVPEIGGPVVVAPGKWSNETMTKRPQSCDLSRYRHGCDPPDPRVVVPPQAYASFHNSNSSHRAHNSIKQIVITAVAACAFVSILVGCGSPASDPAAEQSSQSAATRGAQGTAQASNVGVSGGTVGSSQHDRSAASPSALSAGKLDGGASLPAPNIPETIAQELGSLDTQARLRALDHWGTGGAQAPLDLVFEAMEDEDEAVRAKATAIVEQAWVAEQEKESE